MTASETTRWSPLPGHRDHGVAGHAQDSLARKSAELGGAFHGQRGIRKRGDRVGRTSSPALEIGGAIILGIGGDNSNWSAGTFFEGAITAGRPSDATDAAVLANVQAAKYGQ